MTKEKKTEAEAVADMLANDRKADEQHANKISKRAKEKRERTSKFADPLK